MTERACHAAAPSWWSRARAVLLAILGAPDYERYVRHLRARDPHAPVPDRRAYERERLTARYERPGSRCC